MQCHYDSWLVGLKNGCELCGSPLDDLFHCYLDLYLYFTTQRNIEQQCVKCHFDDSWLKMDANRNGAYLLSISQMLLCLKAIGSQEQEVENENAD